MFSKYFLVGDDGFGVSVYHAEGEAVMKVGAEIFGVDFKCGGEMGDGFIEFLVFERLHAEGGGVGLPKKE